jgi:hypothetical protein
MSSTNILYLCEVAIAQYLRSLSLTRVVGIYEGIYQPDVESEAEQTKDYPHVVVACQRAEMPPEIAFNWRVTAEVSVVSNADDTTAAGHHLNVTEVFNSLITDTVAADISAALGDFTAFLVVPQSQTWDIEERSWKSTYTMQIDCCGADIPDTDD